MFAYILNNVFQYFIPAGTGFEIDGVQYPTNWLNLSTPEEKAAAGIVDVVYGQRPDDKYYWVTEQPPVYADGVVTVNYTATPKDLAAGQAQLVNQVNQSVHSLLLSTDFMDFRPNYTPPTGWLEWRESVRVACQDAKVAINACTTVEELVALSPVDWPKDPNWVAPAVSGGAEV